MPGDKPARELANVKRLVAGIWRTGWEFVADQVELHRLRPPGRGLSWVATEFAPPGSPVVENPPDADATQGPPPMPLKGPLTLPPDTDDDIVRRPMSIYIDGKSNAAKVFADFPPINPETNGPDPTLVFREGAQVKIELSFIDSKDRESDKSVYEFVATEDLKPGKPGAMSWGAVEDDPTAVPIDNPPEDEGEDDTGDEGEEA